MEKPNYEAFKTFEQIDSEIAKRKDTVCNKVKLQGQIKQAKKDSNSSYNEQIKSLQEEIDHEVEVIDEFNHRKLELQADDVAA